MEFLRFLFDALERAARWADLDFWEALLAAGCLGFAATLYRLHKSRDAKEFRFEQFFTENGRASIRHLAGWGAFGVHSWITCRYTVYTPLNEAVIGLVSGYALLWAGVLMLGRGFEQLLTAVAFIAAKKFGVDLSAPQGAK